MPPLRDGSGRGVAGLKRREAIVGVAAAFAVIAGAVIVVSGMLSPVTFGWFAYQPMADASLVYDGDVVIVSRWTVVGWAAIAIGLIVIAFLIGRGLGARRRPEAER